MKNLFLSLTLLCAVTSASFAGVSPKSSSHAKKVAKVFVQSSKKAVKVCLECDINVITGSVKCTKIACPQQ